MSTAARSIRVAIAGDGWRVALEALDIAAENARTGIEVRALDDSPDPHWLVCFDDTPAGLETKAPIARRIIVISEPPGIKTYHPGFLAQFGVALSPFPLPSFQGKVIASHPAIPWFYGCRFGGGKPASWRLSADELLTMPMPAKSNTISVVLSRKTTTELHRARLRCVEALERAFPQAIRIYGTGFTPIDDKAAAIDPARFHLSLENTRHPHYWTEKLADALIGWSMPLYDGAPEVEALLPARTFRRIDVTDVDGAKRVVAAVLDAGESAVDIDALAIARARIIREFSLPATIRRAISQGESATSHIDSAFGESESGKPVKLLGNKSFKPAGLLARLNPFGKRA